MMVFVATAIPKPFVFHFPLLGGASARGSTMAPRQRTFTWQGRDFDARQRFWHFPCLAAGDDVYVELRYVLHDIGVRTATWTWVSEHETLLVETLAALRLDQLSLLRSKVSEQRTSSKHFRHAQNCKEFQVSCKLWLVLYCLLQSTRQVTKRVKDACKSRLRCLCEMVGSFNPCFVAPVKHDKGAWGTARLRLSNLVVSEASLSLVTMFRGLGIGAADDFPTIFVALLTSRNGDARECGRALLAQFAVWCCKCLVASPDQRRHTEKRALMPVLRGRGKKARRCDPSFVLSIALAPNKSADACAEKFGISRLGFRCVCVALDAYGQKLRQAMASQNRFSMCWDGSSFNGEDFHLVTGFAPAIRTGAVLQPQALLSLALAHRTRHAESQVSLWGCPPSQLLSSIGVNLSGAEAGA